MTAGPARRVLVFGGSSGIGLAAAERFSRDGAAVAIVARDAERARAAADRLGCVWHVADVADAETVAEAVGVCAEALDGLDTLINAAGVAVTQPLLSTPLEDWLRIVSVNLSGVFHALRAAGPHLLDARPGVASVVNVASISGVRPAAGEAPYAAAKAGVIALTAAAALELAPRVRVNAVSPGPVATPMLQPYLDRYPDEQARFCAGTPLGRMADVDEIADTIHWLCCGRGSASITGRNVIVDGGLTLRGSSADGMLERIRDGSGPLR